ncbi:MAG TPA: thiamine pyrophosphate-binding protein [Streptosporangiaceae bacterium]|nr:thiamine pyrophosphate-binding protein [Streptosporangiaceae bacterium]
MTATLPAGRAMVEALEAEGITTVFGIPGGHILPVYDAVYESLRISGQGRPDRPRDPAGVRDRPQRQAGPGARRSAGDILA